MPPQRTEPGYWLARLAEIDDDLANYQDVHADLAANVIRNEDICKELLAELIVQRRDQVIADEDDPKKRETVTETKTRCEHILHVSQQYGELKLGKIELERARKRFDYLKQRSMIGGTIGRLIDAESGGRHGQGSRGQTGVGME
jgi:hypothetical protein